MGCSSKKPLIIDDNPSIKNSNYQYLQYPNAPKFEGKDSKISLTEENDIKIHSEMLVSENKKNLLNYYKPIEIIGQGAFGKVYKVEHLLTKKIFAMKSVPRNCYFQDGNKNFLREISILRKCDHPNILKIYEYFISENHYYFIMEYFPGGDLYQLIYEMDNYNEHTACIIMKQIFSAVSYLHHMNIVHRDLKPENMMIYNNKDKSGYDIKLIDFGTANYVKEGKPLTMKIGSPYYIAPEVLRGEYGRECDLWSCGVLLYILIVGYPPFDGNTKEEVMKRVFRGNYKMNGTEWESVSKEAKDLIEKLLQKRVGKRISAIDALKHPWIIKYSNKKENNSNNNNEQNKLCLKQCLHNFSSKQKLHQASIAFIVHHMTNYSMIQKLTAIFKELDESGEGLLSKEELKKGYMKFFSDSITDCEFEDIMKAIDQDKSGQISIEEFLRATLCYENLVTEKNLKYAFDYFDKDHSGYLSPDEVREIFGINEENYDTMVLVNEIIKEVDLNGDGMISYEEFKEMMVKRKSEKIGY